MGLTPAGRDAVIGTMFLYERIAEVRDLPMASAFAGAFAVVFYLALRLPL